MRKGIIVIIVLIILDQLTKYIADSHLDLTGPSIIIIPEFFRFTLVYNFGAPWGILAGKQVFLISVTFIALFIFGYLYRLVDFRTKKLYSIGLTLMYAGAIGNLIDRLVFGYVIDFINFDIPLIFFTWNFPVFNIADICLTVGVVIFAIHILFFDDVQKTERIETSDE